MATARAAAAWTTKIPNGHNSPGCFKKSASRKWRAFLLATKGLAVARESVWSLGVMFLSLLSVFGLVAGGTFAFAAEQRANPPNLFAPPASVRPLQIAIYDGPGSGEQGIVNVSARARQLPDATVAALKPEEIGTRDLSQFDIIIFSGGSGSAQAKAIGEAGRKKVRQFVEGGGGYLGICAGAYLACARFDWGLGILNAKTVSNKWQRGRGTMQIQLTEPGRNLFGPVEQNFSIRYANGPIIQPLGRENLPAYQVAALFRTEIAEHGTPAGVMVNSPAAVFSTFGKGRVLTISPHSEDTPGLENFVPRALAWLAAR
jgi:putative intracellular protease/amidase